MVAFKLYPVNSSYFLSKGLIGGSWGSAWRLRQHLLGGKCELDEWRPMWLFHYEAGRM